MKKLKFALPKGSLNSDRWSTEDLLKEAGFDIKGYAPSSRSYSPVIANDSELEVIVDRPQNMPADLRRGVIDLGIFGEDIAEEWILTGVDIIRLCDLEYGYVNLVVAVPDSLGIEDFDSYLKKMSVVKIIRCTTEFPLIAQDRIFRSQIYNQLFGNKKPIIVTRYWQFGDNPKLIITESYGATESTIKKGSADFIVESTSSGKTLAENGLKPIEILLESSADLYTTNEILKDPWRADKIDFVKILLEGVVKARKTDYIWFNTPKQNEQAMLDYLEREKLFAKEPAIIRNGQYLQISIEIPKSRWLEMVRSLKENGAEDIIRLNPSQIID